jgi:NAD(P)-dependent dehydrogenase (short-subunit alcohol dehydrogenase family)
MTRVAVVTGASSGIGLATTQVLAKRGWHVAAVCRNPARAAAALDSIDGDVDVVLADLSLLEAVRKLSVDLHDRYDHIDALINNAGINVDERVATSEGLDAMMVTNYLAPVLLSRLSEDLLRAADQGRIVNVASEAHRFASAIDFDTLPDLGAYRGGRVANRAYGLTKLLLILHTQEYARRLAASPVTANSLCPGLVNTNILGAQAMVRRVGDALARTPLISTPQQGAQMSIKLATAPGLATTTGQFFTSIRAGRVVPPVSTRSDNALQRELFDRTEAWIGLAN